MIHLKKVMFIALAIVLLALPLAACAKPAPAPAPKPAPPKIVFGCSIPLSGWAAPGAELSAVNSYDLWVKDVNARGGIYVKEFDKKVPVEIKYYDDKSDPATTVKMAEKLMLDDKVDFMLAPWGTAWHFAEVPILNKYGYFIMGITVSSNQLMEKTIAGEFPWYFSTWSPASEVSPHLVDICEEFGTKSAAVIYVSTLFGIDFAASIGGELSVAGISTTTMESYPVDVMDFTPLLNEIKTKNPDALLAATYDLDGTILMEQMMAMDYNPKLLWIAGCSWGSTTFVDKFGKAAMEGVMGEQVWNPEMGSPGAQEFWDGYIAMHGREPDLANAGPIYATLQIYEQAIEKAGTLDREKVRDTIAAGTFSTITGDISFKNKGKHRVDTES